MINLVDTHAHLTGNRFINDLDEVIKNANSQGVSKIVTIGTGIADGKKCLELSNKYNCVIPAVGLDPFSLNESESVDKDLQELEKLISTKSFCAIGEIGLDYYYKDLKSKETQKTECKKQFEIANKNNLPVLLHVREAHDDMINLLSESKETTGIIHSFSADKEKAKKYLDLGWTLSFNGMVTFKNAKDILEAAIYCPLDRIVFETDAPYLSPMPNRGRRCEPAAVRIIAEFLAEKRGVSIKDFAGQTTKNAEQIFRGVV